MQLSPYRDSDLKHPRPIHGFLMMGVLCRTRPSYPEIGYLQPSSANSAYCCSSAGGGPSIPLQQEWEWGGIKQNAASIISPFRKACLVK